MVESTKLFRANIAIEIYCLFRKLGIINVPNESELKTGKNRPECMPHSGFIRNHPLMTTCESYVPTPSPSLAPVTI